MRRRIIDGLLVVAAVIGALWLGYLIYHNHFGGHVERQPAGDIATAVQSRYVASPVA